MRRLLNGMVVLLVLLTSFLGTAFSAAPAAASTNIDNNNYSPLSFSYSPGKIAYRSQSTDGYHEIFTMNTDGSDRTQITFDNADNREPCISRDGTKIVYSDYNTGRLWVMNANGTNQHAVTLPPMGRDVQPSWSPDGAKIVFSSSRTIYYRLYIINEDGSGLTQISSSVLPSGDCQWPTFNEDASHVAFFSNNNGKIFTVKTDGTEVHQVTTTSLPTHPVWSPDGTKILYYHTYPYKIYSIEPDSTDQTLITSEGGADPTWSPDGTGIVYCSTAGITVMDADGNNKSNISTDVYDQEPTWGAASSPVSSATITIVKNTLSVTDTFGFTGTGGNGLPASFTINPLTPTTFTGGGSSEPGYTGSQTYVVAPGSYTITESTLPATWSLYSSVDQNGVESLGQDTVTVIVAADETATIVFNNSKNGEPGWPVPELPSMILLGIGLLGIGGIVLYRKQKASHQRS